MTLSQFLQKYPALTGPIAILLAEDAVALDHTITHFRKIGFPNIVVIGAAPTEIPDGVFHVAEDVFTPDQALTKANRIIAARPDVWVYVGYNAEYLFYPFCETRSITDALTFMSEERRAHVFCYGLDLYAGDCGANPDGVDTLSPMMDAVGYYGADRIEDGETLVRQPEVYGGLRWRFEEHIPFDRRRIERIALFKTRKGLQLDTDFRLNDPEMNSISCPWHHNMTMAVMSFRVAKALRHNPGSAEVVDDFCWSGSEPFSWSSRQLLEMGFIEPGQWF